MASIKKPVPPIKDLEIITDPDIIKTLFEPTRAAIVFKYLVNNAMTVKQLSDALDKNPGSILRHIERLKKAGLVVQVRTEPTRTGIVQRYYRATARDYRLGISGMMSSDGGVREFATKRLKSMIESLASYGIKIPESKSEEAMNLLKLMIERENEISSDLPITDVKFYRSLTQSVQSEASRIMRQLMLEKDAQYVKLRKKWHDFLLSYSEGEAKNE